MRLFGNRAVVVGAHTVLAGGDQQFLLRDRTDLTHRNGFVLQDDGAVDLVKGIKEAEAFLQNMYNTWPDLKFQLLKEHCIGIDGVTVAFLVRATSSRKSRRKFTGPSAQWEFASFYTVDLEQEKFCAGRCCFNMLDVYEMLLPIPKRGGKFFRKLEKMFIGRLAKKQ